MVYAVASETYLLLFTILYCITLTDIDLHCTDASIPHGFIIVDRKIDDIHFVLPTTSITCKSIQSIAIAS